MKNNLFGHFEVIKQMTNYTVGYSVTPVWTRDATIIDCVNTIIVWGIITVSWLLRLLWIFSLHNIKWHKHSLDIKVSFIAVFLNRNNTVTNNTEQNNNTKEKKGHLSFWN